jgi:hypothetical protein
MTLGGAALTSVEKNSRPQLMSQRTSLYLGFAGREGRGEEKNLIVSFLFLSLFCGPHTGLSHQGQKRLKLLYLKTDHDHFLQHALPFTLHSSLYSTRKFLVTDTASLNK